MLNWPSASWRDGGKPVETGPSGLDTASKGITHFGRVLLESRGGRRRWGWGWGRRPKNRKRTEEVVAVGKRRKEEEEEKTGGGGGM